MKNDGNRSTPVTVTLRCSSSRSGWGAENSRKLEPPWQDVAPGSPERIAPGPSSPNSSCLLAVEERIINNVAKNDGTSLAGGNVNAHKPSQSLGNNTTHVQETAHVPHVATQRHDRVTSRGPPSFVRRASCGRQRALPPPDGRTFMAQPARCSIQASTSTNP